MISWIRRALVVVSSGRGESCDLFGDGVRGRYWISMLEKGERLMSGEIWQQEDLICDSSWLSFSPLNYQRHSIVLPKKYDAKCKSAFDCLSKARDCNYAGSVVRVHLRK